MGDHYKDLSDTDRMLSRIDDRLEDTNRHLDDIAVSIDRLTVVLGLMALTSINRPDSPESRVIRKIIERAED